MSFDKLARRACNIISSVFIQRSSIYISTLLSNEKDSSIFTPGMFKQSHK
ncbi:unnamed protein product [Brassica rapa subsp. trilocularis]